LRDHLCDGAEPKSGHPPGTVLAAHGAGANGSGGRRLSASAAKTGMLYSAAIVREVAAFLKQARSVPLVVDPVIISTSGRRLLQAATAWPCSNANSFRWPRW
jgi:hypothetical protein